MALAVSGGAGDHRHCMGAVPAVISGVGFCFLWENK